MSDDFYAKKLGQAAAPQRRESTPQTFAPLPQQPQYTYQPPVPHPASPQHQAEERFDNVDQYWKSLDTDGRRQALFQVAKPGPGSRDASTCPNCGGPRFFSRSAGPGISGSNPPAPSCFDCGYPLIQSGSVGGAGEGAWG